MSDALTPGLRATANTIIRKTRELPVVGEVLVKVGQSVLASDKILLALLPGDLHILRIAEEMDLEAELVTQLLKHQNLHEGREVKVGELLADHRGFLGLFRTQYHSPLGGTVEFISPLTGHVGLRDSPRPIEIEAYIRGKVVALEEGKSVTIEARVAFVQGIFGVGGEQRGKLSILNIRPDHKLRIEELPDNCSGLILVGGTAPSEDTIREAAKRGAVGLVVGSVDDRALHGYLGYDIGIALTGDEDISMTLIMTEGFGTIPMSNRAYNLLTNYHGQEASINGATQVRAGALRPEVIINLDTQQLTVENRPPPRLEVGAKVRLIRVPYFGEIAEVIRLPSALQKIETGAEARVLLARLPSGATVTIPRANAELIQD